MLPWEQGVFGDHEKQTWNLMADPWANDDHKFIMVKKGGFLSHGGTPIAGWLIKENPIRMDDLGVPPFIDIYGKPHVTDAFLKLNSLLRKPWAHLVRWSIQMVIVHSKLWNYHTVTHKNNWLSITSFHSEVTTNEEWWYKMMYGDMICYLPELCQFTYLSKAETLSAIWGWFLEPRGRSFQWHHSGIGHDQIHPNILYWWYRWYMHMHIYI